MNALLDSLALASAMATGSFADARFFCIAIDCEKLDVVFILCESFELISFVIFD